MFWDYLSKRYDKFVNLSESVEATFLAMPDRMAYKWPTAARNMMMDGNYLEFMHKLAEVPYDKPFVRFVATDEEKEWAKREKAKIGGAPTIMWALAGSSIHKVWEGVDTTIARIMLAFPGAKVVTVGDARCRDIIEEPWKKEPRVVRRSGVWSIRQTMAFAQICDLVIGPETGVLNAVSMEKMPKIVLLSHSSVNNLTRDWENTYSVFSTKTPCYPCHKLIYNWDQCVRDENTGTAQCQADIPPDAVWTAMCSALGFDEALNDSAGRLEAA
jgi:ADP-heptose:LPS heptosyltransferase